MYIAMQKQSIPEGLLEEPKEIRLTQIRNMLDKKWLLENKAAKDVAAAVFKSAEDLGKEFIMEGVDPNQLLEVFAATSGPGNRDALVKKVGGDLKEKADWEGRETFKLSIQNNAFYEVLLAETSRRIMAGIKEDATEQEKSIKAYMTEDMGLEWKRIRFRRRIGGNTRTFERKSIWIRPERMV